MKRTIITLAMAAIMGLSAVSVSAASSEPFYFTGDVNTDGKVDITDLSTLSVALVDRNLNKVNLVTADMDGDSNITLADLATLRQVISKVRNGKPLSYVNLTPEVSEFSTEGKIWDGHDNLFRSDDCFVQIAESNTIYGLSSAMDEYVAYNYVRTGDFYSLPNGEAFPMLGMGDREKLEDTLSFQMAPDAHVTDYRPSAIFFMQDTDGNYIKVVGEYTAYEEFPANEGSYAVQAFHLYTENGYQFASLYGMAYAGFSGEYEYLGGAIQMEMSEDGTIPCLEALWNSCITEGLAYAN